MNPAEKKLNFTLLNLTKGFSYHDFIAYRKDRNWDKYDKLSSVDKLIMILQEVKEYKNGYFDDSIGEDESEEYNEY